MSLFVPLDVDYDSDDKVIEAGVMAELLFVRGLAFSKRKLSDGEITRAQLTIVGRSIPNATKHAAALVGVGLWSTTPRGWAIVAWAKRNKSADEVEHIRKTRKEASARGNHERWHVGPGKVPSLTCAYCPDSASQTAPKSDPTQESQAESTESKIEPEVEVKPSRPHLSTSSRLAAVPVDDDEDPRYRHVIDHIARMRTEAANPRSPRAYSATVKQSLHDEHDGEIRRLLESFPDAPYDAIAARIEGNTAALRYHQPKEVSA